MSLQVVFVLVECAVQPFEGFATDGPGELEGVFVERDSCLRWHGGCAEGFDVCALSYVSRV